MSDKNLEKQVSGDLERSSINLSNELVSAAKREAQADTSLNEEVQKKIGSFTKIGAYTESGGIKIDNQNIFLQTTTVIERVAINLPRESTAEFIGRENIIEQLHELLTSTIRSSNVALCGTGGIGKTEIALRYAQDHTEYYSGGICWLSCRDTDVRSQILNFARSYLGIEFPKEMDPENQLNLCWSQWRTGNVLIVFDDVPKTEKILPFLPPNQQLRFKVLMTTRETYGSPRFKFVQVNTLEESVALRLLQNCIGREDTRIIEEGEQAKELCHWLDYLPLGLELVGHYLMRRQDVTVSMMLERLKSEKLGQESMQEGLAAALELSWKELSPDAQQLGYSLSLFALAPIPWWVVENVRFELSPQELEKYRDDELRKFSLLQRQEKGIYQLHHLNREFIQSKLNDDENADNLKQVFCRNVVRLIQRLLANEVPEAETTSQVLILTHIEEMVTTLPHLIEAEDLFTIYQTLLLIYSFQGFYEKAIYWGECCKDVLSARIGDELVTLNLYRLATNYAGQGKYEAAEELLVQVLEIGKRTFSDSDYKVIAAEVFSELGSIRATRGKFEQAEKDCKKAVELKEEISSSNSSKVADSLLVLGEVCRLRGKYDEAKAYYTKAFDIYDAVVEIEGYNNVNPIYIATGYINISVLLLDQGRNEGCESLGLQAVEIVEAALGDEHPFYANCLSNLASAYLSQGQHQQAEECCKKAISIHEAKNNIGHPSYAISLMNLASIYIAQGRSEEAINLYVDAYKARLQIFGRQHDQVAEALVYLGTAYLAQNEYEEAEKCLNEGQEMYQLTLGAAHPKYGEVLFQLGNIRANQEQYDEAENLFRDAIEVFKAAYGEIHPKTSEKLGILALFLIVRTRFEEANALFYHSLEVLKKIFGEDSPNICESIFSIAEYNYCIGHKEEADKLYNQAIAIYEQRPDKSVSPEFSQGFLTLIELHEAQKFYQEAEAVYERFINVTRRLLGGSHPNVALLLTRLAKLKLDGWKYEEATNLYKEALLIRQNIFSETHALVAISMVNLAYAYQALGRSQEAKELYVQALDIRIQIYGESHYQVNFVKNALANLDHTLNKTGSSFATLSQSKEISLDDVDKISESKEAITQTEVDNSAQNLRQDVSIQSELVKSKMAEIKRLEQTKVELESQLSQLEEQQEILQKEVEQYQQKSQVAQANLLKVAEQLIPLTQADQTKLMEPLSLMLSDLEIQRQEYQQAWEQLKTAIQQFNIYQQETDEIRFHIEAHYKVDSTLTQVLPLDRQRVEHTLQLIREQLAKLDEELANARIQHEKSQQKTITRF